MPENPFPDRLILVAVGLPIGNALIPGTGVKEIQTLPALADQGPGLGCKAQAAPGKGTCHFSMTCAEAT